MIRGTFSWTRVLVLCGAAVALLVAATLVVGAPTAAAGKGASASCTVYEIKASNGPKAMDAALKPLQSKLSRGAFRQWSKFEKLAIHRKVFQRMKSVRVALVPGSMSGLLRGITQFKGKKDRLTMSLQLDDKSGTRLQDNTTKFDSGDSILIVDGGLKVSGGSYIFALQCTSK